MFKKLIFPIFILSFTFSANAQFGKLLDKADKAKEKIMQKTGNSDILSQADIGKGLKEALNEGVGEAVSFLSAEDGYYKSPYKILLPEDARKVTNKLSKVPGWDGVETKLEAKMNQAAEIAAAKAKPIFVKAIKGMSFADAKNILMGEQNAATTYLHKSTYDNLFSEFMPVIQSALDEVNAREYWGGAVKAYNKIPFVAKQDPELDQYVAKTALVGLFKLVEKKELGIRENVGERKSDLLKKVFSKQDK